MCDRHWLVLAEVVGASMHYLEAVRAKVDITLFTVHLSHGLQTLLAFHHCHLGHCIHTQTC